jgi:hypothetical protein
MNDYDVEAIEAGIAPAKQVAIRRRGPPFDPTAKLKPKPRRAEPGGRCNADAVKRLELTHAFMRGEVPMPFFYNFPDEHDQPPLPPMTFPLAEVEPRVPGLDTVSNDPALKMLLAELQPDRPDYLDTAANEALEYLREGFALHDVQPFSIGKTGYVLISLTRGVQRESQPAAMRHQRTMKRALDKGQEAADKYKQQAAERVAQVVAS